MPGLERETSLQLADALAMQFQAVKAEARETTNASAD